MNILLVSKYRLAFWLVFITTCSSPGASGILDSPFPTRYRGAARRRVASNSALVSASTTLQLTNSGCFQWPIMLKDLHAIAFRRAKSTRLVILYGRVASHPLLEEETCSISRGERRIRSVSVGTARSTSSTAAHLTSPSGLTMLAASICTCSCS